MSKSNIIINKIFTTNIAILLLLALLLVYYVMVSNSITSNSYKIKILRERINILSETNGQLVSHKLVFEDPSRLSLFAINHNMVKASNIIYLFESSGVARR